MKKDNKEYKAHLDIEAMISTFGLFLIALLALLPPIGFFTFAKDLNYWWIILFFAYYGFLSWILWYIMNRRKMREARMYLGNEKYYEMYPAERRRDQRNKKIQDMWSKLFEK